MAAARASQFHEVPKRMVRGSGCFLGNSPVVKVRVSPMQKLIALVRYRLRGFSGIGRGRPDEEVNQMLTLLVNQRRHRPVIEIIKTATD